MFFIFQKMAGIKIIDTFSLQLIAHLFAISLPTMTQAFFDHTQNDE